ncbi:S24 family peptidase [Pseudomonas solani]|uniref:S24 family peptidase n=1 Tax=Pseudomonas solani TaxID=2731552 RepID=UPI0035BE8EF1
MDMPDRIRELMAARGLTEAELSRRSGVPQPTVHRILKGESRSPRRDSINALSKALGTTAEVLWGEIPMSMATTIPRHREGLDQVGQVLEWDDQTPMEDDEVAIPFRQEIELAAGPGAAQALESPTPPTLRFGKRSLRRYGVSAEQACCVRVRGNSMEPVLPDGSTVAVNQADHVVVDGKMYALMHDGMLRVKTLYRMPGGGLRLRSFNRDEHPDEEYSAAELTEKNITILGRVFWIASFV